LFGWRSWNTAIPQPANIYVLFHASLRHMQTCQITKNKQIPQKPVWWAIWFQNRMVARLVIARTRGFFFHHYDHSSPARRWQLYNENNISKLHSISGQSIVHITEGFNIVSYLKLKLHSLSISAINDPLTCHMDWTLCQKQAFWSWNDEE